MSKRPLAFRHLIRINELLTNASICHVVVERALLENESIRRGAESDSALAEEVHTLAQERGWSIPTNKSYAWSMLANVSDPTPRIVRIVDRDIFELEGIVRETDDDGVGSLATELLNERRQLKRELESVQPQLGLPGAK